MELAKKPIDDLLSDLDFASWAERSRGLTICNPSAVFSSRPLGTTAADRCPDDFEFSAPSLAAALGWTLTLRFLRYLLFQAC